MIVIPAPLRDALEEFCVLYPSDAPDIQEGLTLRDLMLDYVDSLTSRELMDRFGG
jgi:hypothetical protein